MKKPHRLEVALRVKTWEGVLLSEHVIRGDRVELLNYFPSGGVSAHLEIGLDARSSLKSKNSAYPSQPHDR